MLVGVINYQVIGGKYKICPQCGRIYEEGDNYCSQCNEKIELKPITIKL